MPITIQEMPKIPESRLNAWRQDALRIMKSVTTRESLRELAERFLEKWGHA